MNKQEDNELLIERKKLAQQLLQRLVEFTEFEKWQVPYEFLTTMEGLAAIIKKPDWFLFHDENGRWQTSEEALEYQKRIDAVREIARNECGTLVEGDEMMVRYCHYCESIILSSKATLCLRCGEKIPQQNE